MVAGKKGVDLTLASANEKKFAPVIAAMETKHGIPAGMLHRLIKAESAFRSDIINGVKRSSVGAVGIAQFMPATAKELGLNPLDPLASIDAAGRYLAILYKQTKNWDAAVAAYNWGIGNVLKKGLAKAPAETIAYVRKITGGTIA